MNSKQKRGWRRHVIAQLASVTTKDLAEAYEEAMKKNERAQGYIKELEARIAELERVSAGDAKNAERYRMVRRGQHWSVIGGKGDALRAEALDAAIDAAMKKGGQS